MFKSSSSSSSSSSSESEFVNPYNPDDLLKRIKLRAISVVAIDFDLTMTKKHTINPQFRSGNTNDNLKEGIREAFINLYNHGYTIAVVSFASVDVIKLYLENAFGPDWEKIVPIVIGNGYCVGNKVNMLNDLIKVKFEPPKSKEEVLFIDDSEQLLDAARNNGFTCINGKDTRFIDQLLEVTKMADGCAEANKKDWELEVQSAILPRIGSK